MTSGVLSGVKSASSNVAHTATTAVSGAAQKVGSVGKDQAKRVGTAALGVAKASPIELAVTILSAAWLYRSARPESSAEPSKLDQLGDQAKTGGRTALQAIDGMVGRNPLAAGAIALTIGAIVGLLIPESNVENRVMGPKHDELMDKAMGAAQEFTEDITDKVMAGRDGGREHGEGRSEEPGPGPRRSRASRRRRITRTQSPRTTPQPMKLPRTRSSICVLTTTQNWPVWSSPYRPFSCVAEMPPGPHWGCRPYCRTRDED